MKEFIEKLIGRLEELYARNDKIKKMAYEEQDWEKFDLFTHRCEGIYSAISIVNQLAEEYKPTTNSNIQEVIDNLEVYTVGRLKNARVHITVEELQNQIDKLERLTDECKNDVCEWKVVPYYRIPDCGTRYIVAECLAKNFKYCPYCGKEIKAVE